MSLVYVAYKHGVFLHLNFIEDKDSSFSTSKENKLLIQWLIIGIPKKNIT
jgi:hypothetical protein